MSLGRSFSLTWLGHATFKITTGTGKVILIDPWVQGNPACPDTAKKLDKVDLLLLTHGHFDHIADAVEIAKRHSPDVVCIFETGVWLGSKGVEKITGMNKGGTLAIAGVEVTMVGADHSCGISDKDDSGRDVIVYGGDPAGFVVMLEDGFRIYHSGDTNLFGDMKLIGDLYRPDLALLPIGGHYTMGPREAAEAIRLLGVRRVIPMHWGTFPVLAGTPEALKAQCGDIQGLEIHAMKPGETLG
ncbi:MAG TPA: metal-dependent hydrolase [Candidatus Polarisedimenticolia bacterium]|nr:metal-dependent hydrolase [Candidatus Polarisedimenticolia bacterium]